MIFDIQITLELAVSFIQYFLWIGALIYLFENIKNRKLFEKEGYLSWELLKASSPLPADHFMFRRLHFLSSSMGYAALLLLQFIILTLLTFQVFPQQNLWLILFILVAQYGNNFRVRPILSAPLQMRYLIYLGLFFYYLSADPTVKNAAILFIGFQSLYAYCSSGVLKLKSKEWRRGHLLPLVVSAEAHGKNLRLASFLQSNPRVSQLLSRVVIIFECIFPFLIFLGPNGALLFIFCAFVFHFSVAIIMGFNDFLFVFLAPFPALLYFVSHPIPL